MESFLKIWGKLNEKQIFENQTKFVKRKVECTVSSKQQTTVLTDTSLVAETVLTDTSLVAETVLTDTSLVAVLGGPFAGDRVTLSLSTPDQMGGGAAVQTDGVLVDNAVRTYAGVNHHWERVAQG